LAKFVKDRAKFREYQTLGRYCESVLKTTKPKRPKFAPYQNALTDLHKNWHSWLRHKRHPTCKIR